jgi:uncharacterized membrane protein
VSAPVAPERHLTAPTSARVVGVDVARAVALIGMMGTHLLPEYDDAGRITPFFALAAGRSSALFAVLAGVGLALASGGTTPRTRPWAATAARTAVRALLIAAIGVLLVALDPPIAVILTNYGLLFLLALPLLGLRPRALLPLAAAWALVVPLASQALRSGHRIGPGAQIGFDDLAQPVDALTRLSLTGYYPVLTWLGYLALGLAVGRMPLRRTATAVRLVAAGAVLAGSAWLASNLLLTWRGWAAVVHAGPAEVVAAPWGQSQLELRGLYGTTPTTSWWWQAVVSPHSGTPFDLAQTGGSALVVLGLALLACGAVDRSAHPDRGRLPRAVVTVLASTGSMTLTLYSVHVVAADVQQQVADRTVLLLGHVACAALFATLWRRWLRRGPLEQLVHSLSRAAGRAVGRARRR